jgi:hypothetical protein
MTMKLFPLLVLGVFLPASGVQDINLGFGQTGGLTPLDKAVERFQEVIDSQENPRLNPVTAELTLLTSRDEGDSSPEQNSIN